MIQQQNGGLFGEGRSIRDSGSESLLLRSFEEAIEEPFILSGSTHPRLLSPEPAPASLQHRRR